MPNAPQYWRLNAGVRGEFNPDEEDHGTSGAQATPRAGSRGVDGEPFETRAAILNGWTRGLATRRVLRTACPVTAEDVTQSTLGNVMTSL